MAAVLLFQIGDSVAAEPRPFPKPVKTVEAVADAPGEGAEERPEATPTLPTEDRDDPTD